MVENEASTSGATVVIIYWENSAILGGAIAEPEIHTQMDRGTLIPVRKFEKINFQEYL